MGKVINWELCKRFKFDITTEWHIHKPESVREKETHEILWDFERQTDQPITARRQDRVIIMGKNRTCRTVNFAVRAGHRLRIKETEKKDKS